MTIFPDDYRHSTIRQEGFSYSSVQMPGPQPYPFLFYGLDLSFPSKPMLPGIGLLFRRRRICSGDEPLAASVLSFGVDSRLHVPSE